MKIKCPLTSKFTDVWLNLVWTVFHLYTLFDLCIFLSCFKLNYFFSLEKALLCTKNLYFRQNQQFDDKMSWWWICFLQPNSILVHKMWIDGLNWITCGLLWCFYQPFGLSIWRHPFTAEDLLVSNNVMLHFSKSVLMKKQIYILDSLRMSIFSANFIFERTIPLISAIKIKRLLLHYAFISFLKKTIRN